MNPTNPQPAPPQPRGNADAQAKDILDSYFSESENETPETGEAEAPDLETEPRQPEGTDPETEEVGTEEGEQQEYTLAQLAEHLEVDPQALYDAQVPVEGGKEVSIGAIKDTWAEAQRIKAETEQQRAQIEQAYASLQQQQQQLAAQQGMAQLQPDDEERRLGEELAAYRRAQQDQAYWDQQAAKDPGAAALALQRLQGKVFELESTLSQKQQQREAQGQQLQQQYQQQAHMEISQRIPEWTKQEVVRKDWGDISALWAKFGMPQPQIDALWQSPAAMHMSHTFLTLLRKLEGADPGKKKVVPIKGLPGGKRNTGKAKDPRLDALTKAAKKGDRKAQEAVGAALLKNYLPR